MKFSLPLSSTQQKFYGQIIEPILRYYPIGTKVDVPEYREYPGQVELGEIIVENIHKRKNYKARWTDFEREIKKELKKEVEGQSYGIRPSFSSRLIIKDAKYEDLIHFKSLHFSVSLIGPFFTIHGVDETWIVDDGRHYVSLNVVTVSPYKEFESPFNFVKSKIEERFLGYKFIPFRLHSMLIADLYDPYRDNEEHSIYTALFDDSLKGYDTFRIRGDNQYGFNVWINDADRPDVRITGPAPDN